jgi:predicted deacylase
MASDVQDWVCNIDLDRPGKQTGHVDFGKVGEDAGGHATASPLTCIANAEGPTIVLTAGVHGDEYEGQVALAELARGLQPAAVSGRVIIAPTINAAACVAGQRFSPIDGLNLNRVFPGKVGGSITHRIARFIETELYRRADYAVDIHGGGVILHFHPATIILITGDTEENKRRLDLATGFATPHCMLFGAKTMGAEVGIESAMLREGVVGISGEFGGSSECDRRTVDICRKGIRKVLARLGIVVEESRGEEEVKPLLVDLRDNDVYVRAKLAGVLEILVELGERVNAGDSLALVHHPDLVNADPTPILAPFEGIIMAHRALARCVVDDWLFVLGRPVHALP